MIYKKRFYKANDSKRMPTYFQLGQIVTTGKEMKDERYNKKERKQNLSQQFIADDQKEGLSRKNFTNIAVKRRRIGEKKRKIKSTFKKH